MSKNFPAHQFDDPFLAKRLGNWQVPAVRKVTSTVAAPVAVHFGTGTFNNQKLEPRSGPTQIIVDSKGHLLPGVPKVNNAFNHNPAVHELNPPRWPERNQAINSGTCSTMGHKGIITSYLPRTGTVLPTVQLPTHIAPQEHTFH